MDRTDLTERRWTGRTSRGGGGQDGPHRGGVDRTDLTGEEYERTGERQMRRSESTSQWRKPFGRTRPRDGGRRV